MRGLIDNSVNIGGKQTIRGLKTLLTTLILGNSTDHMGELELFGGNSAYGGYIDFHYGNDSGDYTSRIIENSSGNLDLNCNSVTAPASDINNSIVTTVAKSKASDKGYLKLGNGFIFQYIRASGTPSSHNLTVTLPTPFSSNTSYAVACSVKGTNTTSNGWNYVNSQTTTNFKVIADSDQLPVNCVAIGY